MPVSPPTASTYGLVDGRVLVTGGAGFVGSHLVESLAPSNEVVVLDDCSTGDPASVHPDATLRRGDVRNPDAVAEAMAGVDLVVHLAGLVSVARSVEVPQESHATNVGGTLAVLEAAREADARVVFASSAAVYGDPDRLPVPETASLRPASPYGVDKLAADHYVRRYADLYGLETVVLRFFNVYGPGQSGEYAGVISTFLEQAEAGEPLTVHGDGSQTRDFVHVADVVRAILCAARTPHVGLAYNVGTGTATSVRELAETIRSVTGDGSRIVHESARSGDVAESRADLQRARVRLGYGPTVTLREGLASLASEGMRGTTGGEGDIPRV